MAAPPVKAFKVTRSLNMFEISAMRKTPGVLHLCPLQVGQFGFIPRIQENFTGPDMQTLAPFVFVQLLEHTETGLRNATYTSLPEGRCQVPSNHIEVGAEARHPKLVTSDLVVGKTPIQVALNTTNSLLRTWLQSLFNSISSTATLAALTELGLPETVADVLQSSGRRATLIQEFLNGMTHCGTLSLFQGGVPSLETIWRGDNRVRIHNEGRPNPSEFKERSGAFFYMLVYHAQTADGPKYAVYCGQAKNPPKRLHQHQKALEEINAKTAVHYKIGRRIIEAGGTVRMFPITYIPQSMPKHSETWALVELALILMWGSFNPGMLNIDKNSPQEGGPCIEANLSPARETFHKIWSAPLAKRFLDIRQEISARPNLRPFEPKDKYAGCNWSIPVLERTFIGANLWVQTTTMSSDMATPAMWQFRTHARKLKKNREILVMIGHRNKDGTQVQVPRQFYVNMPQKQFPSLQGGSVIGIVIEIMVDQDARHPQAYLEIPETGPFDCYKLAARVGIRAEWLDTDGTWKAQYLKNAMLQPFSALKSLPVEQHGEHAAYLACVEVGWLHCIKLQATLLRWRWLDPQSMLAKRVFRPYNGRVRRFDYDFLGQRIVLSEPPMTSRRLPRLLTLQETTNAIEEEFGHDVNFGYMPSKMRYTVNGSKKFRTKCDLCYMYADVDLVRSCRAKSVIGTRNGYELMQCKFSAMLNRYCTFTRHVEEGTQFHGLTFHVRAPYPEHLVAEPSNAMQILEARDLEAEYAEDEPNADTN
ncbi:hypothetical protein G7046_g8956 [Stylonectria norvegica]|nr:hypothetical protein G7046_g8956 [Stylonectria norvegica]